MPFAINGATDSIHVKKEGRLYLITAVFFLISAVLIGKLFILQVLRYNMYSQLSEEMHQTDKALIPARGEMFVEEGNALYPLVTNKDYYLIFADPRQIVNARETVKEISSLVDISDGEKEGLVKRLGKKSDPYEPVAKKVETQTMDELKKMNIPGIYFSRETYRMYSEKGIGGHFLGFVDSDGVGRYGLEGYFNKELFGVQGNMRASKDVFGSPMGTDDIDIQKSIEGKDLVLTVNKSIQYKACEEIKKGVEVYQAKKGNIIVMNPSTGSIIAICSFPDFDPEKYNTYGDLNVFNNPATFYAFEPGSIFKTITFSIALDLGKIAPGTTYEDTGEIKIVGHDPIRNSDKKAYGVVTMTEALERSLNTGAIFVEERIGNEKFKKYVEDFGFGRATGIELDSEGLGNVSSLAKRGEIYGMTASFGQGITVTSVQFITAFSSLVNGGKLMKPFIVKKIIQDGETIKEIKPQVMRQVISPETSSTITNMMVSVVENGYSMKAKIPGYYIGGKTGTAQVAGTDGKYGEDTIHTFIGFGPAYSPKFTILVEMDNPKKFNFSSETATLVFKNLAEYILHYYNIAPEREKEKK